MQITPGDRATTSRRKSGGTRVRRSTTSATPQINIAYGAYYLRYLLDRYDGNDGPRAGRLQRAARATSTAGSRTPRRASAP